MARTFFSRPWSPQPRCAAFARAIAPCCEAPHIASIAWEGEKAADLAGQAPGLPFSRNRGHDSRAGCQRAMHRAFSCNLDQLVRHRRIGFPFDGDDALEAIDVSRSTLNNFAAVFAVVGCLLAVLDAHSEPAERHLFVVSVDPQRHRGTCAQSCCEIV